MDLEMYEAPSEIERLWRRLETAARPPYMQSWGWIENWLASQDHPPVLHVIAEHGEPIAAAFDETPVLRAPAFPELGAATADFRIVVDHEQVMPHVDLETVRAVEGGYISTRPAPMRACVLHSRLQAGELDVEAATDAPRAHAIFDELLGLRGAPDDTKYRRLIDQRAPYGEIQMLRIRAGGTTLGCFYNVMWHDRVAYQLAGFATSADADLCHAAAIEHNANRGFTFYELHPEDTRLATGETRRKVLKLQRRWQSSRLSA
jgi:CelD/BcsL family acetyltransferase involved in cellulose biosynthesis